MSIARQPADGLGGRLRRFHRPFIHRTKCDVMATAREMWWGAWT